jgi:hypothetical protein
MVNERAGTLGQNANYKTMELVLGVFVGLYPAH